MHSANTIRGLRAFAALGSAIAIAWALSGCGSKPKDIITECQFDDGSGTEAPLWACDIPLEGYAVGAMGSHEKSAAGPAFTRDQATALARVRLARNMRTYVTGLIKQFAETTGAADQQTVDRAETSATNQVTEETLTGSKVVRSIVSPKGTIYVYVALDDGLAKAAAEKAIRTSMNNDQAAWQQWRAGKTQEELAAAIAKTR